MAVKGISSINSHSIILDTSSPISPEVLFNEARLYVPSINKWNNNRADAELVLRHIVGGKSIYVCIPITLASGSTRGNGIEFFNQLDSAFKNLINEANGKMIDVNVGEFSLNSLIPKSSYYWAENDGLQFDSVGINTKANVLIFPLGAALNIQQDPLTHMDNLISGTNLPGRVINSSANEIVSGGKEGQFYFNTEGTKTDGGGGPGSGKPTGMTCEPVLDSATGLGIDEEPTEKADWNADKLTKKMDMKTIWTIVGIVVGIGVLGVLAYFFHKYIWITKTDTPGKPGKMTSIFSAWMITKYDDMTH